jgi:hypothetical protein
VDELFESMVLQFTKEDGTKTEVKVYLATSVEHVMKLYVEDIKRLQDHIVQLEKQLGLQSKSGFKH